MSYSYRPMFFSTINKLQYNYITQDLWKISFVAGLLNVILNILLVPFFDVWATVFSTYISLMFMGFRGYFLKSFIKNTFANYYPLYWFLLICVLTLTVFLLKDIYIIYKIGISLILVLLSIFIFKRFQSEILFKI